MSVRKSTERVRLFRLRKKLAGTGIKADDKSVVIKAYEMICKPPKKPAKSSSDRSREYRARKKALKAYLEQHNLSAMPNGSCAHNTPVPSAHPDTLTSNGLKTLNPPVPSTRYNMPLVCFIPLCRTGYATTRRKNKEAGIPNPSLFSIPSDEETLQKWKQKIPRRDRELGPGSYICELHFEKDCILKVEEIPLHDGSIYTLVRRKPRLKPGSVPTIFPNYPEYLAQQSKMLTSPEDSSNEIVIKTEFNEESIKSEVHEVPADITAKSNSSLENSEAIRSSSLSSEDIKTSKSTLENSEAVRCSSLKKLTEKISNSLRFPHNEYSCHLWKKAIIIQRWSDDYVCDRKLVIEEHFKVKTYIKDTLIALKIPECSNVAQICEALSILNGVARCPGPNFQ